MSINLSEFPQFQLAPDLAGELCFYDKVRAPVRRTEWSDMVAKIVRKGGTSGISYAEYCDARRHQPKLTFFGIYAVEVDNKLYAVMAERPAAELRGFLAHMPLISSAFPNRFQGRW